ncbi:MAG: hypothetical protein GX039_03535 [Clostridia bacterium]|nr:hypothetical protein [Clostridia bacterium]
MNNDILFDINKLYKYFPVYGGALLRKVGDVKAVVIAFLGLLWRYDLAGRR